MKRSTKVRLSTAVGLTLTAVTLTGPLGGQLLADWQCKRGLCRCHPHRYRGQQ